MAVHHIPKKIQFNNIFILFLQVVMQLNNNICQI